MKEVEINFGDINELSEMHLLLKKVFGFPDFYGKNIHALIDCLSSLRYPEDGMTEITLEKDETLLIKIKNISSSSKQIIIDFIIAIENVNERQLKIGNSPSIILTPIR